MTFWVQTDRAIRRARYSLGINWQLCSTKCREQGSSKTEQGIYWFLHLPPLCRHHPILCLPSWSRLLHSQLCPHTMWEKSCHRNKWMGQQTQKHCKREHKGKDQLSVRVGIGRIHFWAPEGHDFTNLPVLEATMQRMSTVWVTAAHPLLSQWGPWHAQIWFPK